MAEKSVITCDLEGRIETFNDGAAALFGYSPDEVIGRKRVSLFSPGLVVLEHVHGWLKTAQREGEYRGRTLFVKKDGTPFAADIRITPTYKLGQQIGYCGVTTPAPGVDARAAMPPISLGTRLFAALVVTRAPFLSATLVPLLVAAIAGYGASTSWWALALAFLGGAALHIAANTFNDYFDHESGADDDNNDYFLPFSGGSRAIELGLVGPRTLLLVGAASLVVATQAGVVLAALVTPWVVAFGIVGAFAAFFYTAPPLRLVAKKGLGELVVGLCFGPLMTGGMLAVAQAGIDVALVERALWIGAPLGLLTTAILWINEFPDAESDARVGKLNLVVVLGKRGARWGYAALVLVPFLVVAAGAALARLPGAALLATIALPLALFTVYLTFTRFESRALVAANRATILLHALFGGLLAVAFAVA